MQDNDSKQLGERVGQVLKSKSELVGQMLKKMLASPESAPSAEIKEYYEMVWDYNLRGGKRLRPALCLLSCAAFGGKEETALPTATGLEVLQNFLLVHDDIEDESELRRGKPCLHKIYGIPSAINAGDGLLVKAFDIISSDKRLLGASKTLRVMHEFIKQLNLTVEGQALEIAWIRNGKWDVSEKDYLKLVELKTAHYTVTTPLKLGAIIAGASSKEVKVLEKIGLNLGVAFQIMDDVLNLEPAQGAYGKEVAGDLLEGKRTLILVHLLKNCSKQEREFVIGALGKQRSEKKPDEMAKVLEMMKQKGSLKYCREKAAKLGAEALELFEKKFSHLPESRAKKELKEVMRFLVERSY